MEGRCAEAKYCASRFLYDALGVNIQLRTYGGLEEDHHQKAIKCGQCVCEDCPVSARPGRLPEARSSARLPPRQQRAASPAWACRPGATPCSRPPGAHGDVAHHTPTPTPSAQLYTTYFTVTLCEWEAHAWPPVPLRAACRWQLLPQNMSTAPGPAPLPRPARSWPVQLDCQPGRHRPAGGPARCPGGHGRDDLLRGHSHHRQEAAGHPGFRHRVGLQSRQELGPAARCRADRRVGRRLRPGGGAGPGLTGELAIFPYRAEGARAPQRKPGAASAACPSGPPCGGAAGALPTLTLPCAPAHVQPPPPQCTPLGGICSKSRPFSGSTNPCCHPNICGLPSKATGLCRVRPLERCSGQFRVNGHTGPV
jgi:hypothetical protein